MRWSSRLGRFVAFHTFVILIASVRPAPLRAQELPTVTYTAADGLPSDVVTRVLPDPTGLLWIGTTTALARFDGEAFKVIGSPDRLDVGSAVNAVQFDDSGHLWIATNGAGLIRFDPTTADPAARFTRFVIGQARPSNRVNALALLTDGAVWAGTDAGVYVGRQDSDRFTRLDLPTRTRSQDSLQVLSILEYGADLWLSTTGGLYRCRKGPACENVIATAVRAIVIDREERLWVGAADGLTVWKMKDGAPSGAPDVIGTWNVLRLSRSSDGAILVASQDGRAIAVRNNQAEVLFETDTSPIYEIVEDAAGNLWVGTRRGLVSIRRQGVRMFTPRHGLRPSSVRGLTRDVHGRMYALTEGFWLHRVDGNRLSAVRLVLPPGVGRSSWLGSGFVVDVTGDVWVGTANGLCRYRGVSFSPTARRAYLPSNVYTEADGLAGNYVSGLFEDSSGNIWISSQPVGPTSLTVWRRHAGHFEELDAARGLPPFNQPGSFAETSPGILWATLREGGIVRIRHGQATVFGATHGLPALVRVIVSDRSGQLWFSAADGISRVVDPAADEIRAEPIVTGLHQDLMSMAFGSENAIFAGTQTGLYVVDQRRGAARPLSSFDGLPFGSVEVLLAGPDGTLLLTAGPNLVRLDPSVKPRSARTIRCVIGGIRIGSQMVPLPEAGVEQYGGIVVPAGRNDIAIDFLAMSPHVSEPLAYEHRLAEITREWSRSSGRQITYAGLGSGRYTFEVRARGLDGSVSAPAVMRFRVLPPWYQRWWFLAICGAALAFLVHAAHRVRLARVIYTEQLRSRIATDLHDDLGASLSQIAVFSEVLRQRRAGLSADEVDGILGKIGTTSRELVSSMSDIVWAVNPRYDSLGDLVARIRRFAEDTFAQGDTTFEFTAPATGYPQMSPAAKREILLIVKEGVTNVVKHAHARRASVSFSLRGRRLAVRVWDDGRGFDPEAAHAGNGLRSLRRRVAALGGELTIISATGQGTEIVLQMDIR
jgi:signal transduction histidine kinase/ligand-binding sensor domain-containing protein